MDSRTISSLSLSVLKLFPCSSWSLCPRHWSHSRQTRAKRVSGPEVFTLLPLEPRLLSVYVWDYVQMLPPPTTLSESYFLSLSTVNATSLIILFTFLHGCLSFPTMERKARGAEAMSSLWIWP